MYARLFTHCLYCIYANKFYARTHVKLRDSGNPPLLRTRFILPYKNGPNNDKAKVIKGFAIPSFDMSCLSESFRVTKQAKGGNVVTYYTAMVTVVENGDARTQGTVKFPSACS